MSSISRRVAFKSSPLVSGEQAVSKASPIAQESMSQQSGQSPAVTPAAKQGVPNPMLVMAVSVVNFVVAIILFTWVLLDRNAAIPPSGSSNEPPSVVSQQPTAVPTDVAVVVAEATATSAPAPPINTAEPPPPANTSEPEPPTATLEPPTATPELPTATPEPPTEIPALPTDTPVPPPPPTDTPVPPPPPPPPTARPRPTKTPIREIVYIVRYGDNLIGIAYRYGTTVNAIMRRNGLTSTFIYAGPRLIIPLR